MRRDRRVVGLRYQGPVAHWCAGGGLPAHQYPTFRDVEEGYQRPPAGRGFMAPARDGGNPEGHISDGCVRVARAV
eukprot:11222937-Lingulodinium_polyedra.AAC.1